MVKVVVGKQGNYPVSATVLKKRLARFFEEQGIVSNAYVELSLVGNAKMLTLSQRFLKEKKIHNVLSFPDSEVRGQFRMPEGTLYLGEIVICFPEAVKEAGFEGKLIEEKIIELAEHGGLHLLGIHHE